MAVFFILNKRLESCGAFNQNVDETATVLEHETIIAKFQRENDMIKNSN